MNKHVEQVFKCDPEFYWQSLFDAEQRTERELKGCGSLSYEVVSITRDAGKVRQVAKAVSEVDAPRAVRKVFGETIGIEEETTWQEGSEQAQLVYRPDKMPDRVTVSGVLSCRGQGDGTCKVSVDLNIKVKIFAIGGIVEKLLAKESEKHLADDAAYFNAHIAPK